MKLSNTLKDIKTGTYTFIYVPFSPQQTFDSLLFQHKFYLESSTFLKSLSHAHLVRAIVTIGGLRRSCDPLSASNTAGTFKDTFHLYYYIR